MKAVLKASKIFVEQFFDPTRGRRGTSVTVEELRLLFDWSLPARRLSSAIRRLCVLVRIRAPSLAAPLAFRHEKR
jgi:hypothetical protein